MVYYGSLIIYGTFFLVNLILAVISDSFSDHSSHERIEQNKEKMLDDQPEDEGDAESKDKDQSTSQRDVDAKPMYYTLSFTQTLTNYGVHVELLRTIRSSTSNPQRKAHSNQKTSKHLKLLRVIIRRRKNLKMMIVMMMTMIRMERKKTISCTRTVSIFLEEQLTISSFDACTSLRTAPASCSSPLSSLFSTLLHLQWTDIHLIERQISSSSS